MDERIRIQALLYPWVSLSVIRGLFKQQFAGPWKKIGTPCRPVFVRYAEESVAIGWFPDREEVMWLDEAEAAATRGAIAMKFPSHQAGLRFFTQGWCNPWSFTAWARVRSWARLLGLMLHIKDQTSPSGWESLRADPLICRIRANLMAAAAGVSGLAYLDPFSRELLDNVPSGRLDVRIQGLVEPLAFLNFEEGCLRYGSAESVPTGKHRAMLEFADAQTAWKSILGKEDHLAAVGEGKIRLSGFIPLADGFGHLVDRLQWYVKPGAK